LGGLWHGANWTFLIWGAWHGAVLAVEKALGIDTSAQHFSVLRWLMCLLLVMLGWVVFRAENLSQALTLYAALLPLSMTDSLQLSPIYAGQITSVQLYSLLLAWLVIIARGFSQRYQEKQQIEPTRAGATEIPFAYTALIMPLFVLAIFKLSAESYSAFLYFQF
jgi:alginate O-acetyltransferase complex protein AlgI